MIIIHIPTPHLLGDDDDDDDDIIRHLWPPSIGRYSLVSYYID